MRKYKIPARSRLAILQRRLALAEEKNDILIQTSGELCDRCNWRFLLPDVGCLNCDRFATEREQGSQHLWHHVSEEESTNEAVYWNVHWAVHGAVHNAVFDAVKWAVNDAVYEAVVDAVVMAVHEAVDDAFERVVLNDPPHSALQNFIGSQRGGCMKTNEAVDETVTRAAY